MIFNSRPKCPLSRPLCEVKSWKSQQVILELCWTSPEQCFPALKQWKTPVHIIDINDFQFATQMPTLKKPITIKFHNKIQIFLVLPGGKPFFATIGQITGPPTRAQCTQNLIATLLPWLWVFFENYNFHSLKPVYNHINRRGFEYLGTLADNMYKNSCDSWRYGQKTRFATQMPTLRHSRDIKHLWSVIQVTITVHSRPNLLADINPSEYTNLTL